MTFSDPTNDILNPYQVPKIEDLKETILDIVTIQQVFISKKGLPIIACFKS
jgi:hypothetical protein